MVWYGWLLGWLLELFNWLGGLGVVGCTLPCNMFLRRDSLRFLKAISDDKFPDGVRQTLSDDEISMSFWLATGFPPSMRLKDMRASSRGDLPLALQIWERKHKETTCLPGWTVACLNCYFIESFLDWLFWTVTLLECFDWTLTDFAELFIIPCLGVEKVLGVRVVLCER